MGVRSHRSSIKITGSSACLERFRVGGEGGGPRGCPKGGGWHGWSRGKGNTVIPGDDATVTRVAAKQPHGATYNATIWCVSYVGGNSLSLSPSRDFFLSLSSASPWKPNLLPTHSPTSLTTPLPTSSSLPNHSPPPPKPPRNHNCTKNYLVRVSCV